MEFAKRLFHRVKVLGAGFWVLGAGFLVLGRAMLGEGTAMVILGQASAPPLPKPPTPPKPLKWALGGKAVLSRRRSK